MRLNVGGRLFETLRSTLAKHPDSLLARRIASSFDLPDVLFYDRNSTAFEGILDIYRSGIVSCPPTVSLEAFNAELEFFGFEPLPGVALYPEDYVRIDPLSIAQFQDGLLREIYERIRDAVQAGETSILVVGPRGDVAGFGREFLGEHFHFTRIEEERKYQKDMTAQFGDYWVPGQRIEHPIYFERDERGDRYVVLYECYL